MARSGCKICGNTGYSVRAVMSPEVKYLRCAGCGVVYQDPLPAPSGLNSIYNQEDDRNYFINEEKGVDYVKGEEWLRKTARFYISLLRKYYKGGLRGASVLDFGCATGVLLDEFRKEGCSVEGIELSKWASGYARNKFRLKVHNEDIFRLKLKEGSFDIITMIHSLEHLPDPVAVIGVLKKWLKPGGILVIATPDANSIGERVFKSRWQYYLPDEHLHLFDGSSIRKFLDTADLKTSGVEHYLWRRRTSLSALSILGARCAIYLAKKALRYGKISVPVRGTTKDGIVVFAVK